MIKSTTVSTSVAVSDKKSTEVNYNSCGLVFTNEQTGQKEHWSQGGKSRYSVVLGKLFFIRDSQVWIAHNSSVNKAAFKARYNLLIDLVDNTAKTLELPRKTLLLMHDKAYSKALSLAIVVSV